MKKVKKKKIIIACDSYKGCLTSREVNEAIASGVKEWNADDASPEIITLEMSDGGEGMLDAFLSATGSGISCMKVCLAILLRFMKCCIAWLPV